MILFGHQTGNPNAHHAALALKEAGLLGAYCTPWYPKEWEIRLLKRVPGLEKMAERFSRRRFKPLDEVRKVEGRLGEFRRLAIRALGKGDEGLSYEINDWMMKKLSREISSPLYRAIYTYEDCAEGAFQTAKKIRKACLYDMPIGYYGWWQQQEIQLAKKYRDWLPPEGVGSTRWVRPEQKKKEMELADVVLTACSFARNTIREFFDKEVRLAPYGVNLPAAVETRKQREGNFRVVYAGTASVRKGVPMLLEVWRKLGWIDAELILAGSWQLAKPMEKYLPPGVRHAGKLSHQELMELFQESDWLILPSNFEGYGLVILEALAHGLPVLASTATGAADLPKSNAVRLFDPENPEQLAEVLIAAKAGQDKKLSDEARKIAAGCSWEKYRAAVKEAVRPVLD